MPDSMEDLNPWKTVERYTNESALPNRAFPKAYCLCTADGSNAYGDRDLPYKIRIAGGAYSARYKEFRSRKQAENMIKTLKEKQPITHQLLAKLGFYHYDE